MWQYKPVLYLLLFLLVDKVLLVPQIQDRFTAIGSQKFDIFAIQNEAEIADHRKKQIWVFGSSRSVPFMSVPTEEDIQANTVLTATQKQQLLQYQKFSLSLPGSTPVTYLHHYLYLTEKGYRPDMVWIEVSPFALNENYSFRRIFLNVLAPNRFMATHLSKYPLRMIAEWLYGLVFTGAVYPPVHQDRATQNAVNFLNPIVRMRLSFQHRYGFTTITERDKKMATIPDAKVDSKYHQFLHTLYTKPFLNNFKIDPVSIDSLLLLVAKLRSDNVPFVIWNPPVHPNMTFLYDEAGVADPYYQAMTELAKRDFFDISIDDMNCRYFSDDSHLSNICYAELASRILEHTLVKNSN